MEGPDRGAVQLRGPRRGAIAREAISFQSAASAIEHAPVPVFARATLWLVLLAMAAAVIWASVAKLDRVVTALGRLVTPERHLVVQPLETSIIRTILVEPGQTVRKGQVLAQLDPTFATAEMKRLLERRDAAEAKLARLRAEIDRMPFLVSADAKPEYLVQLALFDQRSREFELKLEGGDRRLAEAEAALEATRSNSALLDAQVQVARDLEGMRERLHASGVVAEAALLELRQKRLEAELNRRLSHDRTVELTHQIDALRVQREAFVVEWQRAITEQLSVTRLEHNEIIEQLEQASLRADLSTLRAPEDAIVLEIAGRSSDSVVQGAEALFTLVPIGRELEVEVEIDAGDIGHVAVGDEVRVKLDAFPFQRHGLLRGQLRTVSEDALQHRPAGASFERPGMFYRARVVLTATELRNVPEAHRLLPGMQVNAEIRVGSRRVISYFLYPFIRVLDESLREPT